ncbi:MAG: MerR family transcriptional regulator [Lachnospiraceae bacterium]
MYTIGEISKMFGLPVSTLRYYDKEGLFPNMTRSSGIRKFSESEIESLRVIECLKKTGMEIRDIKQFMDWCAEGPSTYPNRKKLFENRKKALEEQLQELEKNMAMIKFKCWYYEQAIYDGNEERLNKIIPDDLPTDIKAMFELAHS